MLGIFASSAQASWQQLPYDVTYTDTVGAPGNTQTTTTPESVPPDQTPHRGPGAEFINATLQGQVTAKFQWTHDVPGDSPPTTVCVLEHGHAQWTTTAGGTPNALNSEPSAQLAAFSPRRRPHLLLAQQAFGGDGSCSDGLGDQTVITGTGRKRQGVSDGYKVVVCTPAAGVVTVPTVTLTASCPQPGMPSWNFNAQVMTLQMTRNGVDITSPNKPEVPVMIGELNQMGVSVGPIPPNVTITYQWSDPGSVVKDYTETPDSPGNPPTTPATPNTALKTPLSAADLQANNPHFYWYDASFAGDAKELSVVVTFDGKPVTVTGKLKVYRPRMDSLTAAYNKIEDPLVTQSYNLWIQFAAIDPGVKFSATATAPNAVLPAGHIGFEQIVTSTRSYKSDQAGTIVYEQQVGNAALDSDDPDPRYHLEGTGTGALDPQSIPTGATNASATIESSDQPGTRPASADRGIDFDEAFDMYLMYKPDNKWSPPMSPPSIPDSIWVPLGKVHWSWSVQAHQVTGSTWTVTHYTPEVVAHARPADPPAGSDWHDLLTWNLRFQNAPLTPYTPNPAW